MFYYLYLYCKSFFSPFNIFQYITLRSFGALLTGLIISCIIAHPIIKKLKKLKIDQQIRLDGPQTHIEKQGTPTMGGIIIIISLIITTILWTFLENRFIIICLLSSIYFGIIGLYDDYLKFIKKDSKGLSGKKKLFLQFLIGVIIAVYLYFYPTNSNFAMSVDIPYLKNVFFNLGFFYILFIILVIVGSSNAVNLTDGLDGLAIGLIMFSALTYTVFAYLAGHIKFSQYLGIIYIQGAGEIAVFLAGLVGASLGFLWFNSYPAEIFMGDTGSLFLGGILGVVAVCVKQELLLVITGGVFVAEALSVMLQVFYFRHHNGKRIFKMAPIHHHFELSGWKESKVVIRFWIIGIVLSLIALSALKIR
ncbi:MAG: phospho-N-acetylmuramoyl-pentapeptide-transferase [Elusimicrobiota bacterium]|jgi:phospho-N-acetylmuramoyl-pentapeptide-transferase|nr:phospho-N-acetylmuramoyl-pentapeptide-transferase [Elusimicrobiota bacterium]